jgi:hypothetical protein
MMSVDLVVKIGLMTCIHTHPYYIQWLNNSGKAKVIHTARVHFSIDTYRDYVDCDVVPMQACSLLLGHPWEFDTDAIHHGRSNKYTLMHNGKKITLRPLTPNEIVQCDTAIAETARRESKVQHASPVKLEQRAPSLSSNVIELKSHAMLAIKSNLTVSTNIDVSFHAIVCRQVLFSLEDRETKWSVHWFDCDESLTWRGLSSNPGQFYFVFLLPLFCLENRVCLSHGVQVVGAAWRVVMRTVAGVGDLVQRTGDGRTGRVFSGRAVERSGGAVYGLHLARGD